MQMCGIGLAVLMITHASIVTLRDLNDGSSNVLENLELRYCLSNPKANEKSIFMEKKFQIGFQVTVLAGKMDAIEEVRASQATWVILDK